jgi:hypothetical protein
MEADRWTIIARSGLSLLVASHGRAAWAQRDASLVSLVGVAWRLVLLLTWGHGRYAVGPQVAQKAARVEQGVGGQGAHLEAKRVLSVALEQVLKPPHR